MHCADDGDPEYVPFAHIEQWPNPTCALVYCPVVHGVHVSAPPAAVSPGSHCVHTLAPVWSACVPAGHAMHASDRSPAAYVPSGHKLHEDLSVETFVYEPDGQTLHTDEPDADAYVPDGHTEQDEEEADTEYEPRGHDVQVLKPTVELV